MDLTAFNTAAAAASPDQAYAAEKEKSRRKAFKAAIDQEDGRRKREEVQVKIRKEKKMDRLKKRRQTGGARGGAYAGSTAGEAAAAPAVDPAIARQIPALVNGVRSGDPKEQQRCTAQFRKLLSIERNPPIQQVIDSGVVPHLVTFLRRNEQPRLQFEAAWALTNIASGTSDHTHFVVHSGAVPLFVYLLSSPNTDVREQAVWALGNIAGDSPHLRNLVLQRNALPPLLRQLQLTTAKVGMQRNATWTLSNFCRGKPQPKFELVAPALDTLAQLIYSTDEEVLTDACWALSYLSDGPNEKIQAVLQSGVCRRLMELLLHPSAAVQTPALRTVGNIVTGDDLQTQVVINNGALQCLATLLSNHRKGIRKEACWTISNITAGSKDQIQAVLDANVIQPLILLLKTDTWDIRKESAWAISNATSGGTSEQVAFLVGQGCIHPLCMLLEARDPRVVNVALEGLENILRIGEDDMEKRDLAYNQYCKVVEEAEGLNKLEALWTHEDHDIYYKAVRILREFWEADEEDGDAQDVEDDGTAHFGVAPEDDGASPFGQ